MSQISPDCSLCLRCVSVSGVLSCQCYQGWTGPLCDVSCPLNCGDHGYCVQIDARGDRDNMVDVDSAMGGLVLGRHRDAELLCVCHWNYTGEKCDVIRPTLPETGEYLEISDFYPKLMTLNDLLIRLVTQGDKYSRTLFINH